MTPEHRGKGMPEDEMRTGEMGRMEGGGPLGPRAMSGPEGAGLERGPDLAAMQRNLDRDRLRELEEAREAVALGEAPWEQCEGVMSFVEAVRDLQFPKTLEEIVAEAGTREVFTSKGIHFPLAYAVLKLKEARFPTIESFQTAVQKHWEGIKHLEIPPEQEPGRGLGPGGLE